MPESLHPELPGQRNPSWSFLEGKVGVYTKFFEFSNFCIPISQFLFDIFGHYQIHLSQLSVIGTAKVDEKIFPTVVEWRTNALKDEMPSADMDLFSLISAPNPAKGKTETRPHAAHKVTLLTATASRVIDMEDTAVASGSSGTPSAVEKSQLDFFDEDPPQVITERGEEATTEVIPESSLEKEVAAMGPVVDKRRRKRENKGEGANAPPKDAPVATKSVSDPDPLSYAEPQLHTERDIVQSFRETAIEVPTGHVATTEVQGGTSAKSQESGKSTPFLSMDGLPEGIYQPGWGVTNNCRLDTPYTCQDMVDHVVPSRYISDLRHLPNTDFFSQYNMNLARQVAMGSQLRLRFEQEVRLLKKATAKIAERDQRINARKEEIKKLDQEIKSLRTVETEVHGLRNQSKNLETLLEAEVDMKMVADAKNARMAIELESLRAQIKAAFEEFKNHEDDWVNSQCAEMDARLDALSIDFNEELYPHMLTAIAGRRWVIGHGLRLAVMKCTESMKLRQVFADVVSDGVAKGMSEGLKHGIEHGKANLDLAAIEAYDPEVDAIYVTTLHVLKDLKYSLVDQLKKSKDATIDLIMSSSQLKIPVYPEVRDPKDPWSFKEEILLEDAIAANISHAEKKKKCRVVCRTHGVGFAHHARSNGVLVSVPTFAPQGLAILLADAATQTKISKDEASLRLLRSKSLPSMYNLDFHSSACGT
uniref:Transposase (Putative), gypsy type n=1 Tax=Tanacetum cinerariifolium TaxID=118510 RepID=A0A699GT66_TANCI|nr:transposase (putative), gypsy type [Tanacetum cinerariifolium]